MWSQRRVPRGPKLSQGVPNESLDFPKAPQKTGVGLVELYGSYINFCMTAYTVHCLAQATEPKLREIFLYYFPGAQNSYIVCQQADERYG